VVGRQQHYLIAVEHSIRELLSSSGGVGLAGLRGGLASSRVLPRAGSSTSMHGQTGAARADDSDGDAASDAAAAAAAAAGCGDGGMWSSRSTAGSGAEAEDTPAPAPLARLASLHRLSARDVFAAAADAAAAASDGGGLPRLGSWSGKAGGAAAQPAAAVGRLRPTASCSSLL
jgi:hypothetical protein